MAMEMSKKLNDALAEQVKREYEAGYIYNGMRIYLDDLGLPGATHWMDLQMHEEMEHAQDFIDFILEAGGKIGAIGELPEAKCDYDGMLDVWESGLEHEKYISKSIRDILEIAIEENHYAAENFLRTYIDEQVEEEDNFRGVIDLIELAGDNPAAKFEVDKKLGQREDD